MQAFCGIGSFVRLDVLVDLPAKYSLNADRTELTVTDVQKSYTDTASGKLMSDLAVIQCNASNKHGFAFAHGYINVLGMALLSYHRNTSVESSNQIIGYGASHTGRNDHMGFSEYCRLLP